MSSTSPTPVNRAPDNLAPTETGRIIIRLDEQTTSDDPDLLQVAREEGYAELEAFLTDNQQIRSDRVFTHVPPGIIRERERIASQGDFPPLKSMTTYWRLDVSDEQDAATIRSALEDMPEVEKAYLETSVLEAMPAGPNITANIYETKQHVLDAAPQGIDARAAWCRTNGMGQGVKVIDLEFAWIKGHEDLPAYSVLHGDNAVDHENLPGDHGAAALGIIGGRNNTVGVIGIAPYLDSLDVASHYDAKTGTNLHVANAIDAATKFLNPGDIISIEVQRWQGGNAYPVEIDSSDLQAIRHATAQGIIVIEAAGNSMQNDLDAWIDPLKEHSLDSKSALFTDSGAIMVGASYFPVVSDPLGFDGHARYYRSNYGSRLNCYALAEMNYSAGYGTIAGASGTTNSYTSNFGETSAATAIIAGAAALVQGWYKSWCGKPLNAVQMRAILSNPANGTRQANVNQDPIGVMPDLAAIMTCKTRFIQILTCILGRLASQATFDLRQFDRFKLPRKANPQADTRDRKGE